MSFGEAESSEELFDADVKCVAIICSSFLVHRNAKSFWPQITAGFAIKIIFHNNTKAWATFIRVNRNGKSRVCERMLMHIMARGRVR